MITQKHINEIAYRTVGCAIEVHKHLGSGLLESVYETCFLDELKTNGLRVKSQVYVPINYKERSLGGKLKLDVSVEN